MESLYNIATDLHASLLIRTLAWTQPIPIPPENITTARTIKANYNLFKA